MGFFDFLFGKSEPEINIDSLVEQIVKESIADLKKKGKFSTYYLEPEAINLASYLYLRKRNCAKMTLPFLSQDVLTQIPSEDYSVSDKVFTYMAKHGEGQYPTKLIGFGKEGYKKNIALADEYGAFLKKYFADIHANNKQETKPAQTQTKSEYVDLGLPSGNLWGTCNIGASAPNECGLYFAWGETSTKKNYAWDTYKLCNGTYNSITKYCTESKYGKLDNKIELEVMDDIASKSLGKGWFIPSKADMQELLNNCTWKWTSINGMYGWKVIGTNGNSIFLPAAGAASSYNIAKVGELGRYWLSTIEDTCSAFNLRFNSFDKEIVGDTRFYGRPIRPVYNRNGKPKAVAPKKTSAPKNDIALNTLCVHVVKQLFGQMQTSTYYASLDQEFQRNQDGTITIHQEEDGELFNDFVFIGEKGWIGTIKIYGQILDSHYQTIAQSREVFGLQITDIKRFPNCVEIKINLAQFGA